MGSSYRMSPLTPSPSPARGEGSQLIFGSQFLGLNFSLSTFGSRLLDLNSSLSTFGSRLLALNFGVRSRYSLRTAHSLAPLSPCGRGAGGEGFFRLTKRIRNEMKGNLDHIEFARHRRQTSDEFERLMWQLVRNRQRCGKKFRREHPLEPYCVDFFCPEARLVVEVDGASHESEEAKQYDSRRDQWMKNQGIRVLRFSCSQVKNETKYVIDEIDRTLKEIDCEK